MKHLYLSVRVVLAVGLWLAATGARAQAPAWQSLTTAVVPSGSSSEVAATATDAQGNVFIGGTFLGTLTLGTTTLVSTGNYDGFVAKWSPATNGFVWAQRLGGSNEDGVSALAVSGNAVYAAGHFATTATFGTTPLTALGTNGSPDAFVTRLTDAGSSGSFDWAQRFGGPNADDAKGLAVTGASVYVAGNFNGPTATFGSFTLPNNFASFNDIYVVKLTDAGATASVGWVQSAGGAGEDVAWALAVRGSNVYVGGLFGGYGPSTHQATFGSTTLAANGNAGDAFVARLTDAGTSGAFSWAVGAGSNGAETVFGLAVNNSAIYAVGAFSGTTLLLGTVSLPNTGVSNGFVAKLIDTGTGATATWGQVVAGAGNTGATKVAVAGSSLYITGSYSGSSASFGTGSLSNSGASDAFVAKLTDAGGSGSFAWAQGAGGPGSEKGNGVALSGTRVVMVGEAQPAAQFGSFTVAGAGLGYIPYVATLPDPSITATRSNAPGTEVFRVFPNPAQARATVQLPAGPFPATLTLLDALGRAVRTQTVDAGASSATLDLAGLAPGLYAVRVQAGAATATQRLVVE